MKQLLEEMNQTAVVGLNLAQYTATILMKNPVFIVGGLLVFALGGKKLKLGKILDVKL